MKKNKKILLLLALSFISTMVINLESYASSNNKFIDVPEGHWAYDVIYDMNDKGITEGIGNGRFGIGQTIKRADFIIFLRRLLDWDIITPDVGSFSDNMDKSKYYYSDIETALKEGIIDKSVQNIRPEELISREEMTIMLIKSLGYDYIAKENQNNNIIFLDVTENIGYISMAKKFGIIDGIEDKQFNPYGNATREEAAATMMRMYNRLNTPLDEIHAFYAISSMSQKKMINDLSSVSFGWSRLEYNDKSGVLLNTTSSNNNDFSVPIGFHIPLDYAKRKGVTTQLMVYLDQNMRCKINSEEEQSLAKYIFENEEVMNLTIEEIVSKVNQINIDGKARSFDGVVIDFEGFKGDELKIGFNNFLLQLNDKLDKNNKSLYVTVQPNLYYTGYDYKTIGKLADKVILMAHDYAPKTLNEIEMIFGMVQTPLTPINEIYRSLQAITDPILGVEDKGKIMLQLSFDSRQWQIQDSKVINRTAYQPNYKKIYERLLDEGTSINYTSYENPYAKYIDKDTSVENIVWYENLRSIEAKIKLAKMFGINDISLWRLGNIPDFKDKENINIELNIWQTLTN